MKSTIIEISNSEIGKRITKAREFAKLTKKDLAEKIQVSPSTIGRYEDGSIEKIKIPIIHSIASALNIDPMWLIGRSDTMTVNIKDRLKDLYEIFNLDPKEFANKIGVSKSTVYMYLRGERTPKKEIMEKIADYFNCDIDYLLGRSDIINKALDYDLSEEDIENMAGMHKKEILDIFINYFGSTAAKMTETCLRLDQTDQIKITGMAEMMLTDEKYTKDTPPSAQAT